MRVMIARNVEAALAEGVPLIQLFGEQTFPRGLRTYELPFALTTVYTNPLERVLFNPVRDANPFFHFYESLWILAGRQDVESLAYYNARMRDYSDDGFIFHAPYGFRLRHGTDGTDQLDLAVKVLQKDPDSRQAVLQIWDYRLDLYRPSLDIPCNDLIFLKVRNGKLNMTVCCRSNDMIWGAYGANAVQFSVILEYLAARLGVKVGVYRQISDSFHIYPDNPQWEQLVRYFQDNAAIPVPYATGQVEPYPMVADPVYFDGELEWWMDHHDLLTDYTYSNPFFTEVAEPIRRCWARHKETKDGLAIVDNIKAKDWHLACKLWLQRREGKCQE